MGQQFHKGQRVEWRWGAAVSKGRVVEIYKQPVRRTLEGHEIVRLADEENPAYLIEQEDESRIMKSQSELLKAG
ncbi:DUF2945 domain-containing protein [Afifella sp. IM 167]|uniref:DUF2945 domain-containing protein n=1 Tax=Afifella sp. IM 167 TaxID=2033586 RepID=UPI001CCBCF3C|nr:DUF2945 domain-containing protein [Afifella sp. IM 167]MBZ8135282.1 DUF2945 domain-containing protein [Afifella sp. IM 167]